MGRRSELVTSDNSEEDSGDAFTDGDFEDSDQDTTTVVERAPRANTTSAPVHETVNTTFKKSMAETNGVSNGSYDKGNSYSRQSSFGSIKSGKSSSLNGFNNKDEYDSVRRDSHGDQNPSIVGIIGDQHSHAEQRLAARRAARAEAREIRMRELERQQREQEDHADKAYDMYSGKTETAVRRGSSRLAGLAPSLHSPRRSSEDSVDDSFSLKDLRHELKEVSEKFRAAMILNAQLDNDKAALRYQLELMKDTVEEQREATMQLQREHKEKCSAHERLKREHASLEVELTSARDAILARDAAAAAAGRAFVEATPEVAPELAGSAFGCVPALALVSQESEQMLNDAGEGTLDVRLQRLVTSRAALEADVRRLKLQLHDERSARQNGAAHAGLDCETDLEVTRKSLAEAKARAARAEAEAALQGAAVARLEAQVARLRARQEGQDEHEHALKQERRRLQREAREALNRVEELETENNHLTKRLDKLKNAKSALLKEL